MPKIIDNLEEKILTAAEKLFLGQGFQATDMRNIAQEADIAVGTIYKYYKDKHALYVEVMARCWGKTIGRLEAIGGQGKEPEDLLREMLEVLVKELTGRQPLSRIWTEISAMYMQAAPGEDVQNHFHGMHGKFAEIIGAVLAKMMPLPPKEEDLQIASDLGSFAFVMAVDTSMLPPEQAVEKSRLIADLLINYVKKRIAAEN